MPHWGWTLHTFDSIKKSDWNNRRMKSVQHFLLKLSNMLLIATIYYISIHYKNPSNSSWGVKQPINKLSEKFFMLIISLLFPFATATEKYFCSWKRMNRFVHNILLQKPNQILQNKGHRKIWIIFAKSYLRQRYEWAEIKGHSFYAQSQNESCFKPDSKADF